jgi:hypothetical protein
LHVVDVTVKVYFRQASVGYGGITPPPSCNCTEWRPVACGLGNCTSGQMFERRTCTVVSSICPESRCVYNETCLEKRDFDFYLSEEEVSMTQGAERKVKLRINNTGNAPVEVNISAESACCIVGLSEKGLEIAQGGSLDVFVSLRVPMNQSEGECPVTVMVASAASSKAKGLKVTVTKSDVLETLERQKEKIESLKEQIYELAMAGADIGYLFQLYRNSTWAVKDVTANVQRDYPEGIDASMKVLDTRVKDMEGQIQALSFYRPLFEYRWYIVAGIIEFIIVAYLATQLLWPLFRLGKEIFQLTMKERELVQTRISTEKQYFKRQIDENMFNTILIKKQEEILNTRSLLTSKKAEMNSIFKARLSLGALYRWVSAGPRRLASGMKGRAEKGPQAQKAGKAT